MTVSLHAKTCKDYQRWTNLQGAMNNEQWTAGIGNSCCCCTPAAGDADATPFYYPFVHLIGDHYDDEDSFAWVTRLEHPKGPNDKVKRPERLPARSQFPRDPRLLVAKQILGPLVPNWKWRSQREPKVNSFQHENRKWNHNTRQFVVGWKFAEKVKLRQKIVAKLKLSTWNKVFYKLLEELEEDDRTLSVNTKMPTLWFPSWHNMNKAAAVNSTLTLSRHIFLQFKAGRLCFGKAVSTKTLRVICVFWCGQQEQNLISLCCALRLTHYLEKDL